MRFPIPGNSRDEDHKTVGSVQVVLALLGPLSGTTVVQWLSSQITFDAPALLWVPRLKCVCDAEVCVCVCASKMVRRAEVRTDEGMEVGRAGYCTVVGRNSLQLDTGSPTRRL